MNLGALADAAGKERLALIGACHDAAQTVALLGPAEPGFWPHFTASQEYRDRRPDPLDRWSKRVITALAESLGGAAVFPSDGPPWPPFTDWALASGACHVSPVGLLVHAQTGLWLSFRGAVVLSGRLDLPAPLPSPCNTCADQPCVTICPAGAMTAGTPYDVARCHAWLDQPAGHTCLAQGCLVRRACPAGRACGRLEAQSAFHMSAFHR